MAALSNGSGPIKMGFSLGSRKQPPPAPKTASKRSHSLLEDEERHEDDTKASSSSILTFGTSSKDAEKPQERVIPALPNAERWNHGSRKRRRIKSSSTATDTASTTKKTQDGEQDLTQQYGLVVPPRPTITAEEEEQTQDPPAPIPLSNATIPQATTSNTHSPRTADEEALAALTGALSAANAHKTIRPASPPLSDQAAFERDFRSAPAAPTASDYAATPVDGFGAALLRGMLPPGASSVEELQKAWEARAPKSVLKRERNGSENAMKGYRLGLGAKASGLGIEKVDLRVGKKKQGEGEGEDGAVAGPLRRRNRVTGEEISEEEFKERIKVQREEARLGKLDIGDVEEDGGGKERRRERRHREEETDEEYYERKKREKDRRRRERDEDYDRDRERKHRSRGDDADYERKRRYERDRDHESDRRYRCDKAGERDHSSRHSKHRNRSRDNEQRRR